MVEGRKNGVEREIQITRGEERAKIWSGDYHVIRKIWETIMAGFAFIFFRNSTFSFHLITTILEI